MIHPATSDSSAPGDPPLDAVVVGGGVAGLWILNLLRARGCRAILVEAEAIGGAQTLASQGMIHGGLKYALAGRLTGASEAIAAMPERWAACLDGSGELDLRGVTPLADRYYMFAAASTLGQLTGFFASRALRGRIRKLPRDEYPPVFADPAFRGVVYALNDFVLDTDSLLRTLAAPVGEQLYRHRLMPGEVRFDDQSVTLDLHGQVVRARHLVLAAGAGAQQLLDGWGLVAPTMQRRPLHQVVVRHDYPHPLYAHCLTGIRSAEPRLTITSHPDGAGWLWYLGGQIAYSGVEMEPDALIRHAREELAICVPWIDFSNAAFSTLRIDRAEPAQVAGRRPDEAFAVANGRCIVCWPTKLSLTPDLGDKVLHLLGPCVPVAPGPGPAADRPSDHPPLPRLDLPAAGFGRAPWMN